MPQLDRIIVFTQIFWLFFTFMFLYLILTHFFFPIFLKSLKSRKLIVNANSNEIDQIEKRFIRNQEVLTKILNEGLSISRTFYSSKFLLNDSKLNITFQDLDKQIVTVILNLMLYCDIKVLKCIPITSKSYNINYYI